MKNNDSKSSTNEKLIKEQGNVRSNTWRYDRSTLRI